MAQNVISALIPVTAFGLRPAQYANPARYRPKRLFTKREYAGAFCPVYLRPADNRRMASVYPYRAFE
ncbi:hypothetical protein GCM10025779_21490 [Arthrobacter cryoconiti]